MAEITPGTVLAINKQLSDAYWREFENMGPRHKTISRWLSNNPNWHISSEVIARYVGKEGQRK